LRSAIPHRPSISRASTELALGGGLSGKPLVVVFSCVHCPYVVAWEDRLNDVARDYEGRAGLVAVNSNAGYLGDSVDDMEARSSEKSFAFPFLYDETQEGRRGLRRRTDARGLPLRRRAPPRLPRDARLGPPGSGGAEPYLRNALDAVLEGGTPAVQDVPAVGCTIKWRR
jgi:hypothetical protein